MRVCVCNLILRRKILTPIYLFFIFFFFFYKKALISVLLSISISAVLLYVSGLGTRVNDRLVTPQFFLECTRMH